MVYNEFIDMAMQTKILSAISEWKSILGPKGVVDDESILLGYASTTLNLEKKSVLAVLFVRSKVDIISSVRIASHYKIPLYPISTGKNWGFGSRSPVGEKCVVLDLSNMNKIISVDSILGIVTLEPGVTFDQLSEYLTTRKLPFIAPVIGVGGNASVTGNLIERGRSMSGSVDRASTLMALEAILANGDIYSSFAFGDHGDKVFHKWKPGPYIDGLFLQSNLGIVTKISVALARKPERVLGYLVHSEAPIGQIIDALRLSVVKLGDMMPSIRVVNKYHLLTRSAIYASETMKNDFLKENNIDFLLYGDESPWSILGYIGGDGMKVSLSKKILKGIFKKFSKDILFFDKKYVSFMQKVVQIIPWYIKFDKNTRFVVFLIGVLNSAIGKYPSQQFLPLWKKIAVMAPDETQKIVINDFDGDENCGFLFFQGVLPMVGDAVSVFYRQAELIKSNYGFDFVISFLNISSSSLKVNMPIIFNKSSQRECLDSKKYYEELEVALQEAGGYVDRKTIGSMESTNNEYSSMQNFAIKLKTALDPDNILSPGRYI